MEGHGLKVAAAVVVAFFLGMLMFATVMGMIVMTHQSHVACSQDAKTGPLPSGQLTPGQMVQWFEQQSVGPNGSAGIVGNAMQENSMSPQFNSGGWGLWQLTPASGLQDGLTAFASARGLDPQTDAAQMGYLMALLRADAFPGLLRDLNSAVSPQDAADTFERVFENAGAPALANREAYAVQALQQAGGGGGVFVSQHSAGQTCTQPISSGSRAKLVAIAKDAAKYHPGYLEARPIPNNLTDLATQPTDCSGFVDLVYKAAGWPDPNGTHYDGEAYGGSASFPGDVGSGMGDHGASTNSPQPGDLAFWVFPGHVAIFIGNGEVMSFGSNPGPKMVSLAGENSAHGAFVGFRTYPSS